MQPTRAGAESYLSFSQLATVHALQSKQPKRPKHKLSCNCRKPRNKQENRSERPTPTTKVPRMARLTYIAAVLVLLARLVHRVAWYMVNALVSNTVVALHAVELCNLLCCACSHCQPNNGEQVHSKDFRWKKAAKWPKRSDGIKIELSMKR